MSGTTSGRFASASSDTSQSSSSAAAAVGAGDGRGPLAGEGRRAGGGPCAAGRRFCMLSTAGSDCLIRSLTGSDCLIRSLTGSDCMLSTAGTFRSGAAHGSNMDTLPNMDTFRSGAAHGSAASPSHVRSIVLVALVVAQGDERAGGL